jgi:hypothetical protein
MAVRPSAPSVAALRARYEPRRRWSGAPIPKEALRVYRATLAVAAAPHSGLKEAIMSGFRVFGMSREWLIGLGALVTVAGVIFTLQGLGYIGGSVMTGVTAWAVVGPIAAVVGLAMVITGLRRRTAA